jgi:endoglucanase
MQKKCCLFICALCVIFLSVCVGGAAQRTPEAALKYTPKNPDAVSKYSEESAAGGKTAFEYFNDEKIAAGWNLGNTLESHNNGMGGETLWGNTRVNQALMDGLKEAGFDIIRIPITWMGHFGEPPDHHISPSRLKRVEEVVLMAHNAGLKVIINLHHDGATENSMKEDGWLSITKAAYLDFEYQRITYQFARVWTQIAVYFKNYGEWLMFEPFNEIHDGSWGGGDVSFMQPQFDVINKWNQIFTDAVRNAGGNNAVRYLVIPGYCTNIKHTLADYFVLPNDRSPGRQIVTFHYYDPYEFGIAGRRATWGSPADKQKVEDDFAPFKKRFVDNNIPVIIGECGAVLQLYPSDPAKESTARQSRFDYLPYVFGAAKKYGLVPLYWDNGLTRGGGEKFGLFNRSDGRPNSNDSNTLIKSMIQAAK